MTTNEMPDEIWVDGVPDDLIGILGEYSVNKHDNGCTRYLRADATSVISEQQKPSDRTQPDLQTVDRTQSGDDVREAVQRVRRQIRMEDGPCVTLTKSNAETLIRAAQYEQAAVLEASRLNKRCLMLEREIAASTPATVTVGEMSYMQMKDKLMRLSSFDSRDSAEFNAMKESIIICLLEWIRSQKNGLRIVPDAEGK